MEKDNKQLFPIGSVVLLEGGNIPLMVYGRMQTAIADGRKWDYVAVPYPEGNSDGDHTYLFNHRQIETLLFIGYQTEQEDRLRNHIADIRAGKPAGPWPPPGEPGQERGWGV